MLARYSYLRPLRAIARVLPLIALLGCLYVLQDRLTQFEMEDVGAALRQLSVWQWAGAVALTGLSFCAVGQYDAVIHRVLGTGVSPARARAAGMRAIALSQTVGFSSLSGGLVRLHGLPELDLWTISRLSLLVSLSFLGAWAVLAGGVVLVLHGGLSGVIVFFLAVIGWRVVRFRPVDGLPGLSPRIGLNLLVWTAIDTSCAAMVLWVLLPPEVCPAFPTLFAAYLLALGAGLLSQSPAGLGAFELTLLMLLPQVDQEPLLAAVLAYRVIYFLCPALIALAFLVRPAVIPAGPELQTAQGAAKLRALARAPQADWTLAHQGAEIVLNRDQSAGWLLRRAGGCLVALGRPLGRPDLTDLRAVAKTRGLAVALYKADARTAALARAAGWTVCRISQDAVIVPDRWSLDQPACRQTRRKLRGLQAAGLRIVVDPTVLPLADMARVAQDWAARHGGEKGFSMGQFDPALLAQQRVVLGYIKDRLVGFASFHTGRQDWALDLMRHSADAPCGLMHGLVHAGIMAATDAGIRSISLAAVPQLPGVLARLSNRWPGAAGLRQFKRSFGPAWQPLYLCAPGRYGLVRAGAAIVCAVHVGLVWQMARSISPRSKATQDDHENFRFETGPQACDAQGMISCPAGTVVLAERHQMTGRPDDPRRNFVCPPDQRPFPPA